MKHPEEVINYCIDNKLSFAEGYAAIIENKLNSIEEGYKDLRLNIATTIKNER